MQASSHELGGAAERAQAALGWRFATEEEAKAARDGARVAARRGQFVHRNQLTVEACLRGWLEGHALEVKPKTHEDYRSLIERYVVPRIVRMRPQSVRPSTLSTSYAILRHEEARQKMKGLSPRTVNYVHSVLRSAARSGPSRRRRA